MIAGIRPCVDGEHDEPGRPPDAGVRVGQVAGVRGLAVRARRDEPEMATDAHRDPGPEERGDRLGALILMRCGRHREPRTLAQQGDEALDVVAGQRVGEPSRDVAVAR